MIGEEKLLYGILLLGIAEQDPANVLAYGGSTVKITRKESIQNSKDQVAREAKRFCASVIPKNHHLNKVTPEMARKLYRNLMSLGAKKKGTKLEETKNLDLGS